MKTHVIIPIINDLQINQNAKLPKTLMKSKQNQYANHTHAQ